MTRATGILTPPPRRERRARRSPVALIAVLSAVVLVAGCSSSQPSPSGAAATQGAGGGSAAPVSQPPAAVRDVLILGTDISDTRTLDPHRSFDTSPNLSLKTAYDNLVTVEPDDYSKILPELATTWERTADGTGWTFHLRENVTFASGNPFTADDVKYSFERLKSLKDGPSVLADNMSNVTVVDPQTVTLTMGDPKIPFLSQLVAVPFGIVDSKTAQANGGTGDEASDTAAAWFDQSSAGTGAYQITGWDRGQQVTLEANPTYWGGTPPFKRVIIKGFSDTSAELLALQNGDIDLAQNLSADQLATLEGAPGISIVKASSLDFLYWTLSANDPPAAEMKDKRVRQAIFEGVDYDGIIAGLLGGDAVRPAGFMPIGIGGMTPDFAAANRWVYNPEHAKQLLSEAGLASGFNFDLHFGTFTFAGVPMDVIAQKIQSDLSKIGITANLMPADQATFSSAYRGGEYVSGIKDWIADGPEAWTFVDPSIGSVTKRSHWTPTPDIAALAQQAAAEPDAAKQASLYQQFQAKLMDQAVYSILFQPSYRWAVRDTVTNVNLTAAGWAIDLTKVAPGK